MSDDDSIGRLSGLIAAFFAQWGETSKKLQESSDDRLDRANTIVQTLGRSLDKLTEIAGRNAELAAAQGELNKRSLDAMNDRLVCIRDDRDNLRDRLSEAQDEIRRLTDLCAGLRLVIVDMSRGGHTSVSATIGDITSRSDVR